MKKIAFFFSIFLLVLTVVFFNSIPRRNNNVAGVSISKFIAYQKINNGNLIKFNFNQGNTALDLLKNTAVVKVRGLGQNSFVVGINGKIANEKEREFWALYINEKKAPVGAGSYQLKNNDKIEWNLEKF